MIAATLLSERASREKLFPKLHEAEWLMLLDLWDTAKPLPVNALQCGPYITQSTALRHIVRLADQGLIERNPDPADKRRVWVTLSVLAYEKLEQFATEIGARQSLAA